RSAWRLTLSPLRPPVQPASFSRRHRRPPSLHSFPTRRSSDLLLGVLERARAVVVVADLHLDHPLEPDRIARGLPRGSFHRRKERSEEHTSELQSPDHLVCRLLLEKTKTH